MSKLARRGDENGMFGVHRFGKDNPFYGRTHSKETIEKIRLAKIRQKQTKEANEKRSDTLKGRIFTKEHRDKISHSLKGKPKEWLLGTRNHAWKGNSVGYHALHAWVARHKGRPRKCEHCGTIEAKKYEWANISKQYRRDLDDWIRLCVSCHHVYDDTVRKTIEIKKKKKQN